MQYASLAMYGVDAWRLWNAWQAWFRAWSERWWCSSWAPTLYFPLSGSVTQTIDPDIQYFFDSIPPTAGDSTIERRAFEVASYGRQLGLISEVLIDLAKRAPPVNDGAARSLDRLVAIKAQIDELKRKDASELADEIEALLDRLKERHADEYPALRQRIERALSD